MIYEVKANDRARLRMLAEKQLEYARLPVMDERKRNWFNLKDEDLPVR
jgi:hypothetical protein